MVGTHNSGRYDYYYPPLSSETAISAISPFHLSLRCQPHVVCCHPFPTLTFLLRPARMSPVVPQLAVVKEKGSSFLPFCYLRLSLGRLWPSPICHVPVHGTWVLAFTPRKLANQYLQVDINESLLFFGYKDTIEL